MNILYIRRDMNTHGTLKKMYRHCRKSCFFTEQDGFFEASLQQVGSITEVSVGDVESNKADPADFDATIVNLKAKNFFNKSQQRKFYQLCRNKSSKPLALFIGAAQAEYMLDDEALNNFDVIFKREPFKDKDRYAISDENKSKIRPTMICSPTPKIPRDTVFGHLCTNFLVRANKVGSNVWGQERDVFFVGKMCKWHSLREDVVRRLVEQKNIDFHGGLLSHESATVQSPAPELRAKKLRGREYFSAVQVAKVNIALDGVGQYTFRHQELLALGAFMMSGPSIRELELPMPLEENKHYVAFDNLDDMVEKIRYYLEHDAERKKIAAAGKELFDTYYDPVRHGKELRRALVTN